MELAPIAKNYTEFYGAKGVFQSPNSKVKLHYVLATAGGGESSASGSKELLSNLKPLRDYINVRDITDLSDILQRDLSDNRVAKGIVRYLLSSESNSPIFFPSIVVVLIPKKFFNQQGSEDYPKPKWSGDEKVCSFGDMWLEEPIPAGEAAPISRVKIDFETTIPLVIDGQHRTAGFRFVSNVMDFNGSNRVFQPFYKSYQEKTPRVFNSDLPLTLVWFESLDEHSQVRVKDFARNMFVDINQSSQQISASRKILLDEKKPTGFLTRAFYDYLAINKGFEIGDDISLFHSGFDYPHDLKENIGWSKQTIFLPEIIDLVIRGLLYNERVGQASVTSPPLLKQSKSHSHFDSYFGEEEGGPFSEFHQKRSDIDGHSWFETKTSESLKTHQKFADHFTKKVGKPLYDWLNHNLIFRTSAQVSKAIDEGCDKGEEAPYSGTSFAETWKDVVCSGLGLYYDYQGAERLSSIQGNSIKEVDNQFSTLFEKMFWPDKPDASRSVYDASRSVMYVMGYTMLIDVYARLTRNHDLEQVVKDLIQEYDEDKQFRIALMIAHLRRNSNLQFSGKFTFIKNPDPKSWPRYRNIFLRFHSNVAGLLASKDMLEWLIFKPEWEDIGKAYFKEKSKTFGAQERKAWLERDSSLIDEIYWDKERAQLISQIRELFELCGLEVAQDFK